MTSSFAGMTTVKSSTISSQESRVPKVHLFLASTHQGRITVLGIFYDNFFGPPASLFPHPRRYFYWPLVLPIEGCKIRAANDALIFPRHGPRLVREGTLEASKLKGILNGRQVCLRNSGRSHHPCRVLWLAIYSLSVSQGRTIVDRDSNTLARSGQLSGVLADIFLESL